LERLQQYKNSPGYKQVHKQTIRESNLSQIKKKIHPGMSATAPDVKGKFGRALVVYGSPM